METYARYRIPFDHLLQKFNTYPSRRKRRLSKKKMDSLLFKWHTTIVSLFVIHMMDAKNDVIFDVVEAKSRWTRNPVTSYVSGRLSQWLLSALLLLCLVLLSLKWPVNVKSSSNMHRLYLKNRLHLWDAIRWYGLADTINHRDTTELHGFQKICSGAEPVSKLRTTQLDWISLYSIVTKVIVLWGGWFYGRHAARCFCTESS